MTSSTDLFQLADAVAEALGHARAADLKEPIRTLDRACDDARRAWSGSNLGYHADVYTQDLRPGAQFNPEWGLMDRWPVHQPDNRWQIFDPHDLSVILVARAGIDDLDLLKERLRSVRDELITLKEQAISLLTVALGRTKDVFLDRKLKEVEAIVFADPSTISRDIARDRVPSFSRDSEAVAQGARVAAHQRLKGVCLSAAATENGLNVLHRTLREAASHMVQLAGPRARGGKSSDVVFIGHGRAPQWREFKDFINDRAGLPYEEFNRVPVAGTTNIARLSQMLDAASIAFLILTGEDEQVDGELQARMNVIHEAGLFQGRLGFEKAIILLEEGCKEFSNIAGLGQIRFPKGNIAAAYEEVRRVLEREGLLPQR